MSDPSLPIDLLSSAPVFLSYSRVDREFASGLSAELHAQNIPLWRDVHDIPAGSPNWWRDICDAIDGCSSMVLCLSLSALQSTVVGDEWNHARSKGKRIIPVMADEVFEHPDVRAGRVIVPAWMRNANWLDLRPSAAERDVAFANLLHALRTPYKPAPVPITVKASQLPHNFVPRPREFEPLVRALAVEASPGAVALTAALRGAGGYGKTTMAKALCRDLRVSGAFPDGIYWVTLGEKLLTMSAEVRDKELIAHLLDLVELMDGKRPTVQTLEAAEEEWTRAVADKRALLVVDDAWAEAHVRPFLVPGKRHATIITTRFDECVPRGAGVVRQRIDQMDADDALALLTFNVAGWQAERVWFVQTSKLLGRSAQLIGIVNSAIANRLSPDSKGRGKGLREVLAEVQARLDYYGVTAFQPNNPAERERAFGRTIEVGIERLETSEREPYRRLGLFPEDVPVPLTTLARLWELDPIPTADFCEKLAKSSLVQDYDEYTLTIHDVTLKYLRERLTDAPALHTRLLEAWGSPYALPDEYAWRYYGYHLLAAGRADRLRELLLDYRWLRPKLEATDINALLADCDRLAPTADEPLRLLRSALSLSAHLVAADKHQFTAQLGGRLWLYRDRPAIAKLLDGISTHDEFVSLNPTLTPAGGLLLRTLAGHTDLVYGALVLPDGRLLSWSADKTLRQWSAEGAPLRTLEGHTDFVEGALVLADGRLLSWSADHTLRLWSAEGDLLRTLEGHTERVDGALIVPDGRLLSWTGSSEDTTLRLWSANGDLLRTLKGHTGGVSGGLVLPDGRLLSWTGSSEDTTLRLWSAEGAPLRILEGHTDAVFGALVLADGRLLSWSNDKTLRLWSADGAPRCTLEGHTDVVRDALVLPDGRLLSWSNDKTLRLWSADGDPLRTLEGHTNAVFGALVLPDGHLLSWSFDSTLRLWNAEGVPLRTLEGHTDAVYGALVLADSRLLSWTGSSEDTTLRLWSAEGDLLRTLKGHTGSVEGALVLADGRLLSWSADHTLRLWSTGGASLRTLEGHTDAVFGALVLPDGRLLSWSWDNTLRLWSANGDLLRTLEGHTKWVFGALVLADGRLLSWSWDETLRLWSAEGAPLRILEGHTDAVFGALVLADGRLLSWSWDNTLRLWSAEGVALRTLEGHTDVVRDALVLADGRLLSWSNDKTLRLWSAEGAPLRILEGHTDAVFGALVLPDGHLLSWTGSSEDTTLRLWSTDGDPLRTLKGHTATVYGALVLPDGRLLSWSWDNTLRLWSAEGVALRTLKGHTSAVYDALVLPDGRLLSRSEDKTLRLWSTGGVPLRTLEGHTATVYGALVLPDGHLLSWAGDQTLRLWSAEGKELAAFYGDAPITCCALLADGKTVAAGDNQGRVMFLRLPD